MVPTRHDPLSLSLSLSLILVVLDNFLYTVRPRFTGPRFTGIPIYREDKLPPIEEINGI